MNYVIIITEGDVKLNMWHIAMEKLYRTILKQNKTFKKLEIRLPPRLL